MMNCCTHPWPNSLQPTLPLDHCGVTLTLHNLPHPPGTPFRADNGHQYDPTPASTSPPQTPPPPCPSPPPPPRTRGRSTPAWLPRGATPHDRGRRQQLVGGGRLLAGNAVLL